MDYHENNYQPITLAGYSKLDSNRLRNMLNSDGPADKNRVAEPHKTCDTCRTLLVALSNDLTGKVPRKSPSPVVAQYLVPVMQISGLDGCHVCSIISESLCPAHLKADVQIASQSIIKIKIGHYTNEAEFGFLSAKLMDSAGKMVRDSSISVGSEPSPGYPTEPLEASWSISTESDATLNLAANWLECCLAEDRICEEVAMTSASLNQAPFPTYLVEVNQDSIRLRTTKELPSRPKYLTLSYRWGESLVFKLTSKNLHDLLSDIPEPGLPKTFRDAAQITRRLGYQYIWIDSLCIIQDSTEHWQKESVIMGDIYRGSVCTIAALGSKDADGGCFKERNPLCFQHFKFEYDTGLYAYFTPELDAISLHITGYSPLVEPLHERAWVVQERMLSPRTLFFGTYGVYWECVEKEASTRRPQMLSEIPSPKYALHQSCNLQLTGKIDNTYRLFWKWWSRIITQYSPCGLTYRTDKLVALSGLVRLVESRTGLHNLAGLWREYIFPELLWYVHVPGQRPSSSDGYQAPSWSWASLNTEVNVGIKDFNYEFHWKIELLEAVVQKASENGQLSGGHIRVKGPLMKVRWEDVGQVYKIRWGDRSFIWNTPDDGVSFLPDYLPDPEEDIWALLVVHAISEDTWMYMGLVVAKESDKQDSWTRVGSFRQYQWTGTVTEFFQEGKFSIAELIIA